VSSLVQTLTGAVSIGPARDTICSSLPLLAQMRSADLVWKRLILGVGRTYSKHREPDVNDHKRHTSE
jgi:hypothetical protein